MSDPSQAMRMDDKQRAQTQKKSDKKVNQHTYNTLNRTEEERKNKFNDIEITDKDRQRSSEVGISQKHRRL